MLISNYKPIPKDKAIFLKIAQLKDQLAAMDYKGQKYLDGEYTDEEWAAIRVERQSIRQLIRDLEAQLSTQ